MNKVTSILLIIATFFNMILMTYNFVNSKADCESIVIKESSRFSQNEIDDAISATKTKFLEFENNGRLIKLTYDEDKSNKEIKSMLKYENPNVTSYENTIILQSEIYVDKNARSIGSWNPGEYCDWNFILTRKDKNSDWVVTDWGY